MPQGSHARPSSSGSDQPIGRHRAPRPTLGERVGELTGAAAPVLVTVAAGSLSVAAVGALAPGTAFATVSGVDHSHARPAAATVVVRVPAGARFSPPTDTDLARLRGCESTGNYAIDTGNGFYGAYQFDAGTWHSLGLAGLPHEAQPAVQDAAANALEQSRGWQPWPSCSAQLGLVAHVSGAPAPAQVVAVTGTASAASSTSPAGSSGTGPAAVTTSPAPRHVTRAPLFAGHVLSASDAGTYRSDVRLWQERMAARGWTISADGYFGPRTQAVARAFAAEKHLSDGLPGEVGATVWSAAWTLPVS